LRQNFVEWKHHYILYARLLQQVNPFFERIEQQGRLTCRIKRLSGMGPKRDHHRPEAMLCSQVDHTLKQHSMPAVYPIETANGNHRSFKIQISDVLVNSQIAKIKSATKLIKSIYKNIFCNFVPSLKMIQIYGKIIRTKVM